MANVIELGGGPFAIPTPATLTAIARAHIGNDDYHDDPTILELTELAASSVLSFTDLSPSFIVHSYEAPRPGLSSTRNLW
jgi:hypothetical protein